MTDPNGVNTKLGQVLTDFSSSLTALASLVDDMNGLRGAGNLTLGDLNSNLAAIRGAGEDTVSTLSENLPAILASIGIPVEGSIFTIWNMLYQNQTLWSQIANAIGIPPGDATTTVIGHLAAIENLSRCNCGPQPPPTAGLNGCANQVASAFAGAASSYDNRVFAYWQGLPSGVEAASELDPALEGAEIAPTGSWAGWRAFILSRSSSIASLDPRSPIVQPTNQWINLDLATFAAFSVPAGNDITVYLCNPSLVAGDCIEISSVLHTASGGFTGTLYGLATAPPGMSFVNPVNGSNGEVDWSPALFISGNLQNWTMEVISGTVRLVYRTVDPTSTDNYQTQGNYTSSDGVITLPTTNHFDIDDVGTNGPFTVRLCFIGD